MALMAEEPGFQQVQGSPTPAQETIPAPSLVAGAYGFIWVAVLVLLVFVFRRAQRTAQEIDALKRKLDALGGGASKEAGDPRK